jgi:hypothetical protein
MSQKLDGLSIGHLAMYQVEIALCIPACIPLNKELIPSLV